MEFWINFLFRISPVFENSQKAPYNPEFAFIIIDVVQLYHGVTDPVVRFGVNLTAPYSIVYPPPIDR